MSSEAGQGPRWVGIDLMRLAWLVQGKPGGGGFVWERVGQGLVLRSPRGSVWEFRLRGGAWLRRKCAVTSGSKLS